MSSSQGIWLCYSWEKILVYFGTKENGARGDEGSTFKNQTKNKKQKNKTPTTAYTCITSRSKIK